MDTGNFADYAFGSGTNAITFIYTVQEADSTGALDAWDAPAHGELSVCVLMRVLCFSQLLNYNNAGARGD